MKNDLNKILYDPLSYLHPERLKLNHGLISTPLCRSFVNEIIFDVFNLSDNALTIDSQVKFWVHNWYDLPQIVYLIGCHVSRGELMWRGRILFIPAWARNYLKMTPSYIPEPLSSTLKEFTHCSIIKAGYAGLTNYIDSLPPSLKQRFPLSFPDCVDNISSQFTVDTFTLRIISQYVKKNQSSPSIDGCRWCSCEEKNVRS